MIYLWHGMALNQAYWKLIQAYDKNNKLLFIRTLIPGQGRCIKTWVKQKTITNLIFVVIAYCRLETHHISAKVHALNVHTYMYMCIVI